MDVPFSRDLHAFFPPSNVDTHPLLSSFMFHPPTIDGPLSLQFLTIVESSADKKSTHIESLERKEKGRLWFSGITGSVAYNWSQPNMKTRVKIIHARRKLRKVGSNLTFSMLRKELRDERALLGGSSCIFSPSNVDAHPLLSSFMFHPPTIDEPLSL